MNEEKTLFTALRQIADGISAMYGRCCEVAVHDVSKPSRSLVHLSGNVTGRTTGAPATDLLLKKLSSRPAGLKDIHNYKTIGSDGRTIKSTTMFLRNSEDEVVAAFCINLDTTDFLNVSQALAPFIAHTETDTTSESETFSATVTETIDSLFNEAVDEMGKHPTSMSPRERVDLVGLLDRQGVFNMKGSVKRVATLCGVSQFTIYNHLKTTRNNRPKEAQ